MTECASKQVVICGERMCGKTKLEKRIRSQCGYNYPRNIIILSKGKGPCSFSQSTLDSCEMLTFLEELLDHADYIKVNVNHNPDHDIKKKYQM